MLIQAYGLFWRADEVAWSPGQGKKLVLYGRRGKNTGSLRIANFRAQVGIYILYGNFGSYYGGLTNDLGRRLREHRKDNHKENWDRFSWFGFRRVLEGKDDNGHQKLGKLPKQKFVDSKKVIKDLEAIVLKAMDVRNANESHFANGALWEQIKLSEYDKYGDRI